MVPCLDKTSIQYRLFHNLSNQHPLILENLIIYEDPCQNVKTKIGKFIENLWSKAQFYEAGKEVEGDVSSLFLFAPLPAFPGGLRSLHLVPRLRFSPYKWRCKLYFKTSIGFHFKSEGQGGGTDNSFASKWKLQNPEDKPEIQKYRKNIEIKGTGIKKNTEKI